MSITCKRSSVGKMAFYYDSEKEILIEISSGYDAPDCSINVQEIPSDFFYAIEYEAQYPDLEICTEKEVVEAMNEVISKTNKILAK